MTTCSPPARPLHRRFVRTGLLLATLALVGCPAGDPEAPDANAPAQISAEALRLRNVGLAQLENEEPTEAEVTFRALAEETPDDPLPWANLAIAQLRLGQIDPALASIDKALTRAPERPDLLSIRAEVLVGAGREDEALAAAAKAMEGDDDNPEILFQVYRLASVLGPEAEPALERSLTRLTELRPENVVVLSALGRRALTDGSGDGDGDRTAATGAYLRIGELAWQGPAAVEETLATVLDALEAGDLADARVPAQRLENVLKVTPMYQQGQRELTLGIQGVPVWRFAGRSPVAPDAWGEPAAVRLEPMRFEGFEPTADALLAVGDADDDGHDELLRYTGEAVQVLRADGGLAVATTLPAPPGLTDLLAVDLDNDGRLDLLGSGPNELTFWRGAGDLSFTDATAEVGLEGAWGAAAAALDHDIEGDLDLALAGRGLALYRNALDGPLVNVGERVFSDELRAAVGQPATLRVADLDRDGDLDLLLVSDGAVRWLDNLRQGRFADTSDRLGDLGGTATDALPADFDNDGYLDLVIASGSAAPSLYRNRLGDEDGDGTVFTPFTNGPGPEDARPARSLAAADFDHDGRLDLASAGDDGTVQVFARRADGWQELPTGDGEPPADGATAPTALAVLDWDRDGDPDLVVESPGGLIGQRNEGGNANPWLTVRLRGLDRGNSKNNLLGRGSAVEVYAGDAYQFREADSGAVHFGLGAVESPDMLRVTWTNGVPQDRLSPSPRQVVTEEQVLKGSCPFVYAWDGDGFRFVTDLLWGAPAGLPLAPGVWAPADPEELVHLGVLNGPAGPAAEDETLRLAITEELWEAAFFDYQRLWVVDRPADVRVASSLKIVPGVAQPIPERVLAARSPRPVVRAVDGRGRDVTDRVARRDDVYADGYRKSPYQGVAAEPWSFAFDLDPSPAEARRLETVGIRLFLTGWIFPADASLNLAVAQRPDLPYTPPRLEVLDTDGTWRALITDLGHPAGKTKTMVADTPPLPPGATRLRIVSGLWLHWDEIVWAPRATAEPSGMEAEPAGMEAEPAGIEIVGRLAPRAELRYRGFSAPVRHAPNGPHAFDYDRVTERSPWLPFPGRYTRFGDVTELLTESDSRSVILGPGDEMLLTFDLSALPPPAPGHVRELFLESHGWDKDADRNTFAAQRVEPLPFRGMSGYPYGTDESFPDTPLHRRYRDEWLTRVVPESTAPHAQGSGDPAR